MRRVEGQRRAAAAVRLDPAGHGGAGIADAGFGADRPALRRPVFEHTAFKRPVAQPVQPADRDGAARQGFARADRDLAALRVDAHDVERLRRAADAEAPALADGEADNAVVGAQFVAVEIDDPAGIAGAGPQLLDHPRIVAVRDETDVLAVRLFGDGHIEFPRHAAGLCLRQAAQGKAQIAELLAGRGKQEIALVLGRIGGPVQFRPGGRLDPADIVAGREAVGVEVARHRHEVGELDRLVAAHAGQRGLAAQVAVGEIVDHALAEPGFVVEDIVREPGLFGDPAGVADVLPGAAGARPADGGAVVVELQGDADDLIAPGVQHRGGDGTVDTAGHRHHDPRPRGRPGKAETVDLRSHEAGYKRSAGERNAVCTDRLCTISYIQWKSGRPAPSPTGWKNFGIYRRLRGSTCESAECRWAIPAMCGRSAAV